MEKYKAIPSGYMTVGELAKKMGTTVRTLQYYDKEGLLSPSAESEGGRRLYNYKDMIQLHQIMSLKSLGFSLDDIKNRLISLDTPKDVANALATQAEAIKEKVESLTESLHAIEALRTEVLQMQSVDFKKYADIIINLQMKNEFYWLIKHFDDETLDYLRERFDVDSGQAMMDRVTHLLDEAIQYQEDGISPESEQGQYLAKAFWDTIIEFTNGDLSMIPKLMVTDDSTRSPWKLKQELANTFIEPALDVYFQTQGYNPFKEGEK